jgi:hypothetical protein
MEPGGFAQAYERCAQGARGWKAIGAREQHVLKRGVGSFASYNWGGRYGVTLIYNQPVRFAQVYKGRLEVFDFILAFVKINKTWYSYGLLPKALGH